MAAAVGDGDDSTTRSSGEEYRLTIDGDAIAVVAAGASGFRHAFVTLAQWLADGLPSRAIDRRRARATRSADCTSTSPGNGSSRRSSTG